MEQLDLEFSPGEGDDGPVEVSFEEDADDGGKDVFPKIMTFVILLNSMILLGLSIVGFLGLPVTIESHGGVGESAHFEPDAGLVIPSESSNDFLLPPSGSKEMVNVSGERLQACEPSCCCEVCFGLCWLPQPEADLTPVPVQPRRRNNTRSYRLICVFEFIRELFLSANYCTDYVYVTAAPLYPLNENGPFAFTGNISDIHIGPLSREERIYLEGNTRKTIGALQKKFKNAKWFVGVWGTTLWEMRRWNINITLEYGFYTGLHYYLNGVMQYNGLNSSDFDGLAIIHAVAWLDYTYSSVHASLLLGLQQSLPPGWEIIFTMNDKRTHLQFPERRISRATNLYGRVPLHAFPDSSYTYYGDVVEILHRIDDIFPREDYREQYRVHWLNKIFDPVMFPRPPCYQFTTAIYQLHLSRNADSTPLYPLQYSRIDRQKIMKLVEDKKK